MRFFYITCLVFLSVVSVPARADRLVSLFDADVATLANGLKIAVLKDNRADRVRQMLWYGVGSADEPRGLSGMAHFLEHMMFKGTEMAPGDTFNRRVGKYGGRLNAFTSLDVTAYHQTVPSFQLQEVMALEADRMRNLVLALNELESERAVVLEERRQRVENSPFRRMRELMAAALYIRDPYGTPVIGWEHEIKAITAPDLIAFYQQHYRPSNALLVIAGNTDIDEVLKYAQATYGMIPNMPYERPVRAVDPVFNIPRVVEHADSQVAQNIWFRQIKAPGSSNATQSEIAAYSLLIDILGGDNSSRFYKALVLEESLATNVSAYYNSLRRYGGEIAFYAAATKNVSLTTINQRVEEVLATVANEGITQEELDRVRDASLNSFVYLRDDVDRAAQALGQALIIGLTLDELNDWPERLRSVSVEDINAIAQQMQNDNDHVTGYLRQKPVQ